VRAACCSLISGNCDLCHSAPSPRTCTLYPFDSWHDARSHRTLPGQPCLWACAAPPSTLSPNPLIATSTAPTQLLLKGPTEQEPPPRLLLCKPRGLHSRSLLSQVPARALPPPPPRHRPTLRAWLVLCLPSCCAISSGPAPDLRASSCFPSGGAGGAPLTGPGQEARADGLTPL